MRVKNKQPKMVKFQKLMISDEKGGKLENNGH